MHTPASGAELLHLDLFLVPQLHLAEPVLHLVQKVHDIGCFAGGTGESTGLLGELFMGSGTGTMKRLLAISQDKAAAA